MSRVTTETALLEQGLRIILTKGYNQTGIQEVLESAGVPKGSFYYYFKSKADFGLRIIDYYDQRQSEVMKRRLNDPNLPPLGRIKGLFQEMIDDYQRADCRGGCLIGKLSLEMADQGKAFRRRLENSLRKWSGWLADCLEEAQRRKELPSNLDPVEMADFLINSWEGALLRMKAVQNTEPLQTFMKYFFEGFLKYSPEDETAPTQVFDSASSQPKVQETKKPKIPESNG